MSSDGSRSSYKERVRSFRPKGKGGGGGSGSKNFQFGLKIRYGGLEGWPGLFLEQTE